MTNDNSRLPEHEEMLPDARSVFSGDANSQHNVVVTTDSTGRLIEGVFKFKTHAQAEALANMLAQHTPDPMTAVMGFWELLSNAVEHGNLGISMEEKTELLMSGQMTDEVELRQKLSPFKDRTVTVTFRTEQTRIVLRVTDQGDGFDHAAVLRMVPSTELPNGRGLIIASELCFDEVHFNSQGNEVEAVIQLDRYDGPTEKD